MEITSLDSAAEHTESLCNHYWVIESPNGPTSAGECRHCGESREFKNSVQITSWESDANHVQRPQGITASSM